MKQSEIVKNNKLIAKFIGFKWKKNEYGGHYNAPDSYYTLTHIYFDNDRACFLDPNDLKFHTSWDWLMPVVEKIQSLYQTKDKWGVMIRIDTNAVEIVLLSDTSFKFKYSKHIIDADVDRKKELYMAVIEFIKWYNSNKI